MSLKARLAVLEAAAPRTARQPSLALAWLHDDELEELIALLEASAGGEWTEADSRACKLLAIAEERRHAERRKGQ